MGIDRPALTATISTLRAEHLQHDELDGSLRRVVEATCSVFAVAGAGLMLVDPTVGGDEHVVVDDAEILPAERAVRVV